MSKSVDWLPHTRTGQLTMARTWVSVFREDTTDSTGQTVKKYVAWSIPADTCQKPLAFGLEFAV